MTQPMYVAPVPLDREKHAALAIARLERPFAFAATVHFAPMAITEFAIAAHDLPILFAQDGQQIAPVALTGPTAGTNVFVSDGAWTGRYIPAFFRRYPFVSATSQDGQEIVLVEPSWPGFVTEGGEPLFDTERQPTDTLKQALQLVESFANDMRATIAFTAELKRLDLLRPIKVDLDDGQGKAASVDGVMVIDETRFGALPDAEHLFLRKSGYLVPIIAHLMSLANLRELSKGL